MRSSWSLFFDKLRVYLLIRWNLFLFQRNEKDGRKKGFPGRPAEDRSSVHQKLQPESSKATGSPGSAERIPSRKICQSWMPSLSAVCTTRPWKKPVRIFWIPWQTLSRAIRHRQRPCVVLWHQNWIRIDFNTKNNHGRPDKSYLVDKILVCGYQGGTAPMTCLSKCKTPFSDGKCYPDTFSWEVSSIHANQIWLTSNLFWWGKHLKAGFMLHDSRLVPWMLRFREQKYQRHVRNISHPWSFAYRGTLDH